MHKFDCVVIGAGPAGMMAAIAASEKGLGCCLIDRNDQLGRKLGLTGGGRCNVTTTCNTEDIFYHFGRYGRFLSDALEKFSPHRLIEFLTSIGISVFCEEDCYFVRGGGRELAEKLQTKLQQSGVSIFLSRKVQSVEYCSDKTFLVHTDNEIFRSGQRLILAAGGKSWPSTGSTGDGFEFAKKMGHTIVSPTPALGPIKLKETIFSGLAGISLPKVHVEALADGKKICAASGAMMITHDGLSGPVILDASLAIARNFKANKHIVIRIDFTDGGSKPMMQVLDEFPNRLRETFLKSLEVDTERKPIQFTRNQSHRLQEMLTGLKLEVLETGRWENSMVTVGGVSLKEVNPKTMESLIVPGLYFAGEVLDLAASCGGFNIQAAFATGYLSGSS